MIRSAMLAAALLLSPALVLPQRQPAAAA